MKYAWMAFALLMSCIVAQASPSDEPIERPNPPTCPATLEGDASYLFIFEGASGYSPMANQIAEDALKTDSPKDLHKTIADLPELSSERRKTLGVDPVAMWSVYYWFKERHLVPGEAGMPHILYYSKRHARVAAECAESMNRFASEQGSRLEIRAMGFSMGAFAVQRFAEILNDQSIQIESVLTLDPVPQGIFRLWKPLFTSKDTMRFEKTPNVKKWRNVFEKLDNRSLLVGIHGSRVQNADANIELHFYSKKALGPEAKERRRVLTLTEQGQAHMWLPLTDTVSWELSLLLDH